MMNSKFKSIALTCITSVSIIGTAQAQQQELADKSEVRAAAKSEKENKELAELGVGSKAPALKGITWVQGDEVKTLDEKGKLYIIECWASWCGPCVAIIPHMNELHNKYAEKGLVIIGMNVWEDGIDKTKAFVKQKGEGMAYRVAYSGGKGGAFDAAWLEASNTEGIPQAFVVRDGKIIYKDHPGGLDEKSIELMMADDFNAEEFAKQQIIDAEKMKVLSEKLRPLFQAGDWSKIKEIAQTDEYLKGKLDAAGLISQANQKLGDWDAQAMLLKEIIAGSYGKDTLATVIIGNSLIDPEINPVVTDIAKELEPLYTKEGEPDSRDYFGRIAHTRVLFMAGKKEDCRKKLKEILEEVSKIQGQPEVDEFINKLKATIKSVDEGKYPPF